MRADRSEPTDADRAAAMVDEGVGRALGPWQGDVSFLSIRASHTAVAPFPVTWLFSEGTLVVNAADEDAVLSPLLRAEVALRLTQALDDQSSAPPPSAARSHLAGLSSGGGAGARAGDLGARPVPGRVLRERARRVLHRLRRASSSVRPRRRRSSRCVPGHSSGQSAPGADVRRSAQRGEQATRR